MRARRLLLTLVLVVAAGCGSGTSASEPPVVTGRSAAPTLVMSSEARFVVAARQAGLSGGTNDDVVDIGRQACGVLDRGTYDVDAAARLFETIVGEGQVDGRALFEAAVEHLCPEHSGLL